MKKDISIGPKIAIYIVLVVFCLLCVIPIITVISISFSSDLEIAKTGYGFLPKGFTLDAYRFVFKDAAAILRSYAVTIIVTVIGLVLGLIFNAMIAYVLSRQDYRFNKQLTVFLIIPMVLSGGLVPSYIWNTPLAKPALATVGMFITLNYWNDWFQALMYIDENELYNLQYRLYLMMKNVQEMIRNSALSGMGISIADLPTESMRMAMCVVAAGPMLVVFPFFQKYFV